MSREKRRSFSREFKLAATAASLSAASTAEAERTASSVSGGFAPAGDIAATPQTGHSRLTGRCPIPAAMPATASDPLRTFSRSAQEI